VAPVVEPYGFELPAYGLVVEPYGFAEVEAVEAEGFVEA
jgi:hypothetical protein